MGTGIKTGDFTPVGKMLAGIGENAGVLDIGQGYAVTFKVESHNHPSYVEPYQGAATGVGGIVRDILAMGARPVAVMDPLRFGPLDAPDTHRVLPGIVAGIGGYGNCLGLPNIGGEAVFDRPTSATRSSTPSASACCATRTCTWPRQRRGNQVVLYGARTGGDGIGGVSVLASETFDADGPAKRPSVQVGDPFMEKLLIECTLEIFAAGLVAGIQDLGGEYYLDWYNNSLQGSNIPDEYIVPTAFNNSPIREHSNEIDRYYDHDINVGGPIKKDKVWWFGTYRKQFNAVAQPNFTFDKTFDTKLWNAVGKVHLPGQPEEQADRLLPVGPEDAAEPPAVRDLHLRVAGADLHAGLGQLGLQGRVERHGQRQAVSRSALRRLRLLLPADHQQRRQLLLARHRPRWCSKARTRSSSSIATASSSPARPPTSSTPRKGSHTFKIGGEMLQGAVGGKASSSGGGGNIEHIYNNGVLEPGDLRLPDGDRASVGSPRQRTTCLTSTAALDVFGAVPQRHVGGRPADGQRRRALRPLQRLAAGAGAARARTVGPVAVAGADVRRDATSTPGTRSRRASASIFDLRGDGRTVIKANYGLYWHNPGVGIGSNANPNTASKSATYTWNDVNGDRRWQPGEEGAAHGAATLEGAIGARPEHQGAVHARSQRAGSSSSSPRRWACAPASSTRPKTT